MVEVSRSSWKAGRGWPSRPCRGCSTSSGRSPIGPPRGWLRLWLLRLEDGRWPPSISSKLMAGSTRCGPTSTLACPKALPHVPERRDSRTLFECDGFTSTTWAPARILQGALDIGRSRDRRTPRLRAGLWGDAPGPRNKGGAGSPSAAAAGAVEMSGIAGLIFRDPHRPVPEHVVPTLTSLPWR
jgi:hypothetical protein